MRVVIYAAKSTEDDHGSVDDQQAKVREALPPDREVVGVFGEANQSGYRKSRGPQLEAAIRCVTEAAENSANAEVGASGFAENSANAELWVFHSSRLARGTGKKGKARALGKLLYELQERGVTVRSATDDLYTTTEEAWGFASRAASKYSEDLSVWTARGIHKRQDEGKTFGGMPCGWKKVPLLDSDGMPVTKKDKIVTRRVKDEDDAPILKTIWEMVEAGEGWGVIARALNAKGWRTKRGNPWTAPVVRDLVKSPLYTGQKGYPQLIEPDRWQAIQDRISENTPVARQRRMGGRYAKADNALLRGLAFCLKCGQPMHLRSDKTGYYACRAQRRGTGLCDAKPVPIPIADERVLVHLHTFVGSVEDWITERVAGRDEERDVLAAEMERERKTCARLARLRQQRMSELERVGFNPIALEVVEGIDSQIVAHQRKREDLQAQLEEWQGIPDVEAAVQFYNDLVETIRGRLSGSQTVKEVNATLSTIVAGIWLGYDGKRLDASFALRPLDTNVSNVNVGGLAQVLSAAHPSGGKRWPLRPPNEGDPDEVELTRRSLVEQPASESPSTPTFAHLAIPPLVAELAHNPIG